MKTLPRANAFTLIEMLVTISIAALLASLLLGVGTSVFRKANQTGSAANLRKISQGFHTYCADNQGSLPGVGQNTPYILDSATDGTDSSRAHGQNTYLHRDLLPYVGGGPIWRAPGDKAFYHNYYYSLATSYGTALGTFTSPTSFEIANSKLITFQGSTAASKKPIFADVSWEITTRNWNGYDLGDGYNVAFLDGHSAYYKRTATQGRYRTDW